MGQFYTLIFSFIHSRLLLNLSLFPIAPPPTPISFFYFAPAQPSHPISRSLLLDALARTLCGATMWLKYKFRTNRLCIYIYDCMNRTIDLIYILYDWLASYRLELLLQTVLLFVVSVEIVVVRLRSLVVTDWQTDWFSNFFACPQFFVQSKAKANNSASNFSFTPLPGPPSYYTSPLQ